MDVGLVRASYHAPVSVATRIGGAVNFQYSMWSDTWHEKPKYHAPNRFGYVHFQAPPTEESQP